MLLPTGRVLVVEDLPDVRSTLTGLLLDEGYEVYAASSTAEALKLLETERFHVAVLDVCLDESDTTNREGLDLLYEIRKRDPRVAVIIITAHANVAMIQEVRRPDEQGASPAFSFLQKAQMDQLPEEVGIAFRYLVRHALFDIKDLIQSGEGQHVEFKASMRWDLESQSPNKDLHKAVVAAIAGMLNADGGILLIGVADDGTVLGIENDLGTLHRPNIDSFRLTLTDLVQSLLGMDCLNCIHVGFETIEDKTVCVVVIEKSLEPVFFARGSEHVFWLRVGNSNRSLDVRDALEYVRTNRTRSK